MLESQGCGNKKTAQAQKTHRGILPWEVDFVACFVEVAKDEFDPIDSFVPDGVAF